MRKALTFDDVLLVPSYNEILSRKDVDISVNLGNYTFTMPIISANMDTITGSEMAQTMATYGALGILHRFCSIKDNVAMFINSESTAVTSLSNTVGVSVGVNEGLDRAHALYKAGARIFCIDVAHGHSKVVGDMCKLMKQTFSDILLIAGNVATKQGVIYLRDCGADVVKVGIGGGSVCSTRMKTGFGVPQLSAILDCSRGGVPIIADGGCRTPGDIVKALAAGATMVMLGGMLAGTNETPGEVEYKNYNWPDLDFSNYHPGMAPTIPPLPESIYENGREYIPYKTFRGMASREAQDNYHGFMADWKTAEGISTLVQCKGPVENIINDIIGGLRSGMTYCGASALYELQSVEMIEVSSSTLVENIPHANT